MTHERDWCPSCAVVFSRQMIDRIGQCEVTLASGEYEPHIRCAAVDGRLVMLVANRAPIAAAVVDDDSACRLVLCDDDDATCAFVVFGWMARVDPASARRIAGAFADRHLTEDLLDVGVSWSLFTVEAAETALHLSGRSMTLSPEQASLAFSLVRRDE